MSTIGYQPSYTGYPSVQSPMYNPYTSDPNYAGDPGTYGSPYGLSPQASQQNFMMSIYISMMQTQTQLQAGFSQYLGMAQSYGGGGGYNAGYAQPSYGTPSYGAPSYGAPAYSAPTYTPAPVAAKPAPVAAPAAPAKTGGYS